MCKQLLLLSVNTRQDVGDMRAVYRHVCCHGVSRIVVVNDICVCVNTFE
jgi:hypothetical protein